MKFLSILTLFILTFQLPAFSQQDSLSLNTILEKTVKFSEDYPSEKVYLHFDKPYYAIGDTIWFKAYLSIDQHKPSTISKVVYIDVLTSKDSLVQTLRLPVTGSVASGNLTLEELTFKQGNYRFRAYTFWMANFDKDYFFNKIVHIGNSIKKQVSTNISFTGTSVSEKSSKLNARILYQDPDGKPLANKKVTWNVVSDFDVISKGKGETDGAGYLAVSLSSNSASALTKGELYTEIDLDPKAVTAIFPLKSAFKIPDVQFFPEGGQLIYDVASQVAFKAVRADGLSVDVKGRVTDNDGKEVVTFESQHLGMGKFALTPEASKTYKVTITLADGSQSTFPLPKPADGGVNLTLNNSNPDNINIRVATNAAYLSKLTSKTFYLVGVSGGIVCYAAKIPLQNQVFTATISKSKFPSGIAQLTLFSSAGVPVSERLAFIQNLNALNLTLSTDKPKYAPREKVKMDVTAPFAEGSFSVSVIDENKVPFNDDAETTILSSLLLSSDLKGYVEQPNYYFNHTDDKKLADLDLLMLTQGFRKFVYKDILAGNNPKITYFPEQSLDITGSLKTLTGLPVQRASVRLQIPDKNFSTVVSTDLNGVFKFSGLVFPDSVDVTISARGNVNANNMMILLDTSKPPAISKTFYAADEIVNIDSVLSAYLQNSKKQYVRSQVLNEVVITGNKVDNRPNHTNYTALVGLSMSPDQLIEGDRLKGCNIFINCLKTLTTGLTYVENENFYVRRSFDSGSKVPVAIFRNGLAVDLNYLLSINPSEVETVEIFLKDDMGLVNRSSNTNGVIVINTKKKTKMTITAEDLQRLMPQNNVVTYTPKGYLLDRQFYIPKYVLPKSNYPAADLRTTVYWNPKVQTDANGKASFEFYNADGLGNYKAVVEGMDKDGNIGRFIYRYKVE